MIRGKNRHQTTNSHLLIIDPFAFPISLWSNSVAEKRYVLLCLAYGSGTTSVRIRNSYSSNCALVQGFDRGGSRVAGVT